MSGLGNPLSASFMEYERKPGECRWEYMVNRARTPAATSGFSHQSLSPDLLRKNAGENRKQARDECRWNYMP